MYLLKPIGISALKNKINLPKYEVPVCLLEALGYIVVKGVGVHIATFIDRE